MEEKRTLRVMFNKSGSGSITTKIAIPKSFIEFLGVSNENREVLVELDKKNKKITITKK